MLYRSPPQIVTAARDLLPFGQNEWRPNEPASTALSQQFDRYHHIDYFADDPAHHGVLLGVQFRGQPTINWQTFTVRYMGTSSDVAVEYQHMCEHRDDRDLFHSRWFVQAYWDDNSSMLTGLAYCHPFDLVDYIRATKLPDSAEDMIVADSQGQNNWCGPNGQYCYLQQNKQDGKWFVVVRWSDMDKFYPVTVVINQ